MLIPTVHVHVTDLQIQTVRQVNFPAFSDLSLVTCTASPFCAIVFNPAKYPEFFLLLALSHHPFCDLLLFKITFYIIVFLRFRKKKKNLSSVFLQLSYKSIARQ